jgi:transposase-like protein
LQKAKKTINRKPRVIITDGLQTYKRALVKEYGTTTGRHLSKPLHLHNVGIRDIVNNNILERYHNEFRELDKVRRGFKSDKTAQEWNDAFRLYHNFIKRHMALDGSTPAELANAGLSLSGNRWLNLLKLCLSQRLPEK